MRCFGDERAKANKTGAFFFLINQREMISGPGELEIALRIRGAGGSTSSAAAESESSGLGGPPLRSRRHLGRSLQSDSGVLWSGRQDPRLPATCYGWQSKAVGKRWNPARTKVRFLCHARWWAWRNDPRGEGGWGFIKRRFHASNASFVTIAARHDGGLYSRRVVATPQRARPVSTNPWMLIMDRRFGNKCTEVTVIEVSSSAVYCMAIIYPPLEYLRGSELSSGHSGVLWSASELLGVDSRHSRGTLTPLHGNTRGKDVRPGWEGGRAEEAGSQRCEMSSDKCPRLRIPLLAQTGQPKSQYPEEGSGHVRDVRWGIAACHPVTRVKTWARNKLASAADVKSHLDSTLRGLWSSIPVALQRNDVELVTSISACTRPGVQGRAFQGRGSKWAFRAGPRYSEYMQHTPARAPSWNPAGAGAMLAPFLVFPGIYIYTAARPAPADVVQSPPKSDFRLPSSPQKIGGMTAARPSATPRMIRPKDTAPPLASALQMQFMVSLMDVSTFSKPPRALILIRASFGSGEFTTRCERNVKRLEPGLPDTSYEHELIQHKGVTALLPPAACKRTCTDMMMSRIRVASGRRHLQEGMGCITVASGHHHLREGMIGALVACQYVDEVTSKNYLWERMRCERLDSLALSSRDGGGWRLWRGSRGVTR
ncbi:hypothetical protein V8D89_015841 [Ganoderma adspersum]